MSFDGLLAMATTLQKSMEQAALTTKLPLDVDYERVDALLTATLRA